MIVTCSRNSVPVFSKLTSRRHRSGLFFPEPPLNHPQPSGSFDLARCAIRFSLSLCRLRLVIVAARHQRKLGRCVPKERGCSIVMFDPSHCGLHQMEDDKTCQAFPVRRGRAVWIVCRLQSPGWSGGDRKYLTASPLPPHVLELFRGLGLPDGHELAALLVAPGPGAGAAELRLTAGCVSSPRPCAHCRPSVC